MQLPVQDVSILDDALSALGDTLTPNEPQKPESPKLKPKDIISVKSIQTSFFKFSKMCNIVNFYSLFPCPVFCVNILDFLRVVCTCVFIFVFCLFL